MSVPRLRARPARCDLIPSCVVSSGATTLAVPHQALPPQVAGAPLGFELSGWFFVAGDPCKRHVIARKARPSPRRGVLDAPSYRIGQAGAAVPVGTDGCTDATCAIHCPDPVRVSMYQVECDAPATMWWSLEACVAPEAVAESGCGSGVAHTEQWHTIDHQHAVEFAGHTSLTFRVSAATQWSGCHPTRYRRFRLVVRRCTLEHGADSPSLRVAAGGGDDGAGRGSPAHSAGHVQVAVSLFTHGHADNIMWEVAVRGHDGRVEFVAYEPANSEDTASSPRCVARALSIGSVRRNRWTWISARVRYTAQTIRLAGGTDAWLCGLGAGVLCGRKRSVDAVEVLACVVLSEPATKSSYLNSCDLVLLPDFVGLAQEVSIRSLPTTTHSKGARLATLPAFHSTRTPSPQLASLSRGAASGRRSEPVFPTSSCAVPPRRCSPLGSMAELASWCSGQDPLNVCHTPLAHRSRAVPTTLNLVCHDCGLSVYREDADAQVCASGVSRGRRVSAGSLVCLCREGHWHTATCFRFGSMSTYLFTSRTPV